MSRTSPIPRWWFIEYGQAVFIYTDVAIAHSMSRQLNRPYQRGDGPMPKADARITRV